MTRLEVHKFGGTSVANAERMRHIAHLMTQQPAGTRPVVVVSALAGVTNQLVALPDQPPSEARAQIAALRDRHLEVAHAVEAGPAVVEEIEQLLDSLERLASALYVLDEVSASARDRLVVYGEKLSARLVAATLRQAGVPSVAMDADAFLETDGHHGEASPLPGLAALAIRAALLPELEADRIPVVTGFCGRSPEGRTTTLGRGGSDFTATILGGALRATEVLIWTDVDGVYTCDPRVVPDATSIPQLNYREAAELAYFGAKVLHPRTLEPVAAYGIPVRILSSLDPGRAGTHVDARLTPGSHPVKGLSAIRQHGLLSLEGRGMAGVPGAAARMFQALAEAGVSITMISQSNAESSITVAIPMADASLAETALRGAFRLDLAHGGIADIQLRPGVSLIAAVGIGMANTPGIAARVFQALARDGVNVLAIAQGSSELNISLAVEDHETDRALRALHDTFGLARRDTGVESLEGVDLVIHGFGSVARRFLRLVQERREDLLERTGLRLRIVSVCDSEGVFFDPRGIEHTHQEDALRTKTGGVGLRGFPMGREVSDHALAYADIWSWRLQRPIFVDLSSDRESDPLLRQALRAGADVVTANKWPLAGSEEDFRSLVALTKQHDRILRFEATVGAGLPVHDTIEMLRATGDQIWSIVGCLSGTLSWVLERVSEGAPFSAAVREAHERGYTETDPMLDLTGGDVARKLLIAARAADLPLLEQDIAVEPLVDTSLLGLPLPELWQRLPAWDRELARRVQEGRAHGQRLRYVGRVGAGHGRIGLEPTDPSSPLYELEGADNRIVIQSERYPHRPLSVTGPGAGVDVTAMAVLGDVLRILHTRRAR